MSPSLKVLLHQNDGWSFADFGGVIVVLSLLAAVLYSQSLKPKYPLPPGPKGSPIFGNIGQVPAERSEVQFAKWAKEYNSDVIYLNFLGQPVIVLNSVQAAVDLLEKKGAIYSDRPPFTMWEALGFRNALTLTGDGAKFRKLRKAYGNYLSIRNSLTYRDTQLRHAHELASEIENCPEKWHSYLSRFATRVIFSMAFAINIKDDNDPYVKLADKITWITSNMVNNGITIMDIAPLAAVLQHAPRWIRMFIPSVGYVHDYSPTIEEFQQRPLDEVIRNFKAGTLEPSFIGRLVEAREAHKINGKEDIKSFTDAELKGTGGSLFAAGQDTTYATLTIFVMAMVLTPEVQNQAQREIDAVTGGVRLPTFDDWKALPIIERIVYEALRFHQAVPNCIPHRTLKEDVYRGMYIPKRALVIANAWAMLHDPDVYKDPFKFNPDRFLPISEGGAGEPRPVGQFGFGRRVCPGQHLGLASLWIVVATILAKFNILPGKDENGNDVMPKVEFTTGITSHPVPFSCVITPRNDL